MFEPVGLFKDKVSLSELDLDDADKDDGINIYELIREHLCWNQIENITLTLRQ